MEGKTFIGQIPKAKETNTLKTSSSKCQLCDKPVKEGTALSYCEPCEKAMCTDCLEIHSKLASTKNHKLVPVRASTKRELNALLSRLRDEAWQVQGKLTATKDDLEKTHSSHSGKVEEVNRIRREIIQDVESHHDALVEQINMAHSKMESYLQHKQERLSALMQKIQSGVDTLSETDGKDCGAFLGIKTSIHEVLDQIDREIHCQDDTPILPEVSIFKGSAWRAEASTRVNITVRWSLPQQMDKKVHQKYKQVNSVAVEHKMFTFCVYQNELWVAGDKGVFVYSDDLQFKRQITSSKFKGVKSAIRAKCDIIVCDVSGLHHLALDGNYVSNLRQGRFFDAKCSGDQLYALEIDQQALYMFHREGQCGWIMGDIIQLPKPGNTVDKFCISKNFIFANVYKENSMYVYTMGGKFLYSTGGTGLKGGNELGRFSRPKVCEADNEGKVIVCDIQNGRIQAFDPERREWRVINDLNVDADIVCAGLGSSHLWLGIRESDNQRRLVQFEAV